MSRMDTVTVDSGTHAGSHVPVADLLSILVVGQGQFGTEVEMSAT